MVKSLEQLAQESSIFKRVIKGETTYTKELNDHYYSLYHPNFSQKIKSVFAGPEYNQEHFSQFISDLDDLSERFGLVGQYLSDLVYPEKITSKNDSAKKFLEPGYGDRVFRGIGITGGVLSIAGGVSTLLSSSNEPNIPELFLYTLGAFGVVAPLLWAVQENHSIWEHLSMWSSCVDEHLKEPLKNYGQQELFAS